MSQNVESVNNNTNNKPNESPELPRITSELAAQAAMRAKQIKRRLSEEQLEMINKSDSPVNSNAVSFSQSSNSSSPLPLPLVHQNQHNKMVPAVPARAYERAPPPEIPPKRYPNKNSLLSDGGVPSMQNRQPPPLPKKPQSAHNSTQNSAQNSPLSAVKFREKPPVPLLKPEKLRTSTGVSGISNAQSNFEETRGDITVPAPAPTQLANIAGVNDAPYKQNNLAALSHLTTNAAISPSEDFGSADALRGIESGLRNMERAMQEQMSLRSMEAAAAAAALAAQNNNIHSNSTRNILSRNGIYDHHLQTLEDSREAIMAKHTVGNSVYEEMQLRVLQLQKQQPQQQHNSNTSSTSVSSSASPTHSVEYPPPLPNIEHHMRSLDRNLPLEMQYSRHRQTQQARIPTTAHTPPQQNQLHRVHRQHSAVVTTSNQHSQADIHLSGQGNGPLPLSADLREQIRQQLLGVVPPMSNVVHNTGNTPGSAAAAALLQHQAQSRAVAAAQVVRNAMLANVNLTREELRMRRRSSHDETVTTGAESFGTPPGRHTFFLSFIEIMFFFGFPED